MIKKKFSIEEDRNNLDIYSRDKKELMLYDGESRAFEEGFMEGYEKGVSFKTDEKRWLRSSRR